MNRAPILGPGGSMKHDAYTWGERLVIVTCAAAILLFATGVIA